LYYLTCKNTWPYLWAYQTLKRRRWKNMN